MDKSANSASGSSGTALRLSLLNLPQTILDDIVLAVREMIQYDGYLCDLRLVSRQLNEAVLHCLAFRVESRRYFSHYISCPGFHCWRLSCVTVGDCNASFARIMLQGRITSIRKENPRLTRHHRVLAQALSTFRIDMAQSSMLFPSATSQLSDSTLTRCSSGSLVFSDPSSIVFCDAVVMLFEITGRIRYMMKPSEYDNIHCRSVKFWLKNLACYLGDARLLSHYSTDTNTDKDLSEESTTRLTELLAITATRGHGPLLQQMLSQMPLRPTDLSFALWGACRNGSSLISDIILNAVTPEQIPELCRRALTSVSYHSRRLAPGSATVIENIVSQCDDTVANRGYQCELVALAHLGAVGPLRSLLRRFSSHETWLTPAKTDITFCYNPLWRACINGDLECVQALLEGGYFAKMSKESIEYLCRMCVEAAVHANSLPICHELMRLIGKGVEDMEIGCLAAMDDTIDIMTKKLAIQPDSLDTITEPRRDRRTIGEEALRRAAIRLRVENVAFFLKLGIQQNTRECWAGFRIEWRYRRAYEERYQQVQELLKDRGLVQLEVWF